MAISYVSGYFMVVIDGIDVGIVNSAGGGDASIETIKYSMSHDYLVKNHVGNLKYDPMSISCGLSMGAGFKDWIYASLDGNHQYKAGEIIAADYNRKAVKSREFKNALITEVNFPAADAAAKDAAYLSVKWQPETVRFKPGDGAVLTKPVNTGQQKFTNFNFRLTIDGFPKVCAKVNKVDALKFTQSTKFDEVGEQRDFECIPGKMEFSPLKITFAEAVVDELAAWHEQFCIMGNNSIDQEKTFLLEFLDQKREKTLLSIEGTGLGITKLSRAEYKNNEDAVSRCTADFYCDQFKIKEWVS